MDRFDLLDRMLELKSEMLAAEQIKDWHKREELERKLVKVKELIKEFDEHRNSWKPLFRSMNQGTPCPI